LELIEIVGDCVAKEIEALRNEACLCSLVAHADDEKFDLGLFGVRWIVDGLVQILYFLVGELDFNHSLSQA